MKGNFHVRFLGEGGIVRCPPLPGNAAVYNRKTQYQKFGHSVNYLEQQNSLPEFKKLWPEYKELGSHALQATLKRVSQGFQATA